MTPVTHPITLDSTLHLTDPEMKYTLCGVWMHPTFWTNRPARLVAITSVCHDCKRENESESQS